MKVGRLHKYMGFTTNVLGNMEMPMCGNTSQICLTTYPLQL